MLVPPLPVPAGEQKQPMIMGIPTCAGQMQQLSTCRISSLNDESFNVSVEGATIVEPAGAQSKKVL